VNAKVLRNILIVVAVAAAVAFIPGGGKTAAFVSSLLGTAIALAFVLFGARFYRENRVAIFSLGDRYRGLLYGAIAAVVLALAGRSKLLDTGAGTLVFFLLLFGAVAALYAVWQHHRSYGY
jgi:hypothetical protein